LASGSTVFTALETLLLRGIFVPIGGAFYSPATGRGAKASCCGHPESRAAPSGEFGRTR
jgi:hypothetical protein